MPKGSYDVVCDELTTFSRSFKLKDDQGEYFDLDGWTGKMQVRKNPGGDVLLEFSTENGWMVLSGDTGTISRPAEDMDFSGNYQYDIALVDTDDVTYRPVGGSFVINPAVTK